MFVNPLIQFGRASWALLLCFVPFFISAQKEVFVEEVIDMEKGLPSNETYSSFFDDKGDLWVLTDRGLARYDGLKIDLFREEDGLPANAVFKHFKDYKGRVWLTGFKGVCYIENDSIIIPSFNKTLVKSPYFDLASRIHVTNNDQVYIALERGVCGYFECNLEGEAVIHTFSETCLPFGVTKKSNKNYGRGIYLYALKSGKQAVLYGKLCLDAKPLRLPDSVLVFTPRANADSTGRVKLSLVTDRENKLLFLGMGDSLYRVDYDNNVFQPLLGFNKDVICLAKRNNYLYTGLRMGGVVRYNIETGDTTRFLNGVSVSHINFVSDHVLWAATLEQGCLKINTLLKKAFSLPPQINLAHIARPIFFDSKVLRVCEGRSIKVFQAGQSLQLKHDYPVKLPLGRKYAKSVHWLSTDSLLIANYGVNYKRGSLDTTFEPLRGVYKNQPSSFRDSLFSLGHKGVLVVQNGEVSYDSYDHGFESYVSCLLELNPDSVLLGTHSGLYRFYKEKITPILRAHISSRDRVDHLTFLKSFLLVGISGKGLLAIGKDTAQWFSTDNGLSDNFVQSILVKRDTAWIGTANGMNILYNKAEKTFDRLYLSQSISSIRVDDFFDTPKGTFVQSGLDFYKLTPLEKGVREIHTLWLSKVKVADEVGKYGWGDTLLMKNGARSVQVSYRLNELLDNQKQVYQYRISGLYPDWQTSRERVLSMEALPFGKYTLEIRGKSAAGSWSEARQLHLSVIPRFYETVWFQPLLFSFLGLSIGLVVLLIQKQYARSLKRENLLLQTSMNSLKLQINPHFIFNALNSLNYFLTKNDLKRSKGFLSRFAFLMRDMLDASLEDNSKLEDELIRIRTYVELENLRYEHEHIELKIETELLHRKTQIYIPNMMLQPLVENAIFHGFSEHPEHPEIKLRFAERDSSMHIEVVDNGKGIDMELFRIKQNKGSLAIKNIEERLYLLSRMDKRAYKISFTPLVENGSTKGTRVSLVVPYKVGQ